MSSTALSTLRVLQIEDNAADARTVERLLGRVEPAAQVETISNGETVLARLDGEGSDGESPGVDLILLDLNLPRIDGRTLLRRIVSNPRLADVPVVVLSSSRNEHEIASCYELGAAEYATKPADVTEFQDLLASLLRRWGEGRAAGPVPSAAETTSAAVPIPAPHTALVVDDSPGDANLVRRSLRPLEWLTVRTASTAAQADAVMAKEPVDLLILDHRMPGESGLDFLRDLRERGSHVGVILLTGKGDERVAAEAVRRHADDYLSKLGLDGPQLVASARSVLERVRRRRDELRDELTGLYGRGQFRAQLAELLRQPRDHEVPFGLLLLELDRLAAVNDDHGHIAGDRILRQVAEILHESAGASDMVARYGGDAFAILARRSSDERVSAFAEELRKRIAESSFDDAGVRYAITCSVGFACFFEPPTGDAHQALDLVDQALYAAKRRGGNDIEEASPPATRSSPASSGPPSARR